MLAVRLIAGSPPGYSAQGVGQRSRMAEGYFEAFGYSGDLGNATFWAAGRWRSPTMLCSDEADSAARECGHAPASG